MKSDRPLKNILVGLISHNRPSFTRKALATLMDTHVPFDLLIVDNGSAKETKQELFELALAYDARFVSVENRNCNGARDIINHYGLHYDYVVYVDNDVIMPENWLDSMLGHALESDADLLGVSQSDKAGIPGFYGHFEIADQCILFRDNALVNGRPLQVDWVTGHCLMIKGMFLRRIWEKYRLWNRRHLFPIDLDDIDLMMMAQHEGARVFVAPLIVPQNREFDSSSDSHRYNEVRNDFHNYALSCVSFWKEWGLNPLLNWNRGYTGNAMKPGRIHDPILRKDFEFLMESIREIDYNVYSAFVHKLAGA